MSVEKSVKTRRENLISEAIASDRHQSHAVKPASYAKTLVEKEGTLKNLNMALEKLEDDLKIFK